MVPSGQVGNIILTASAQVFYTGQIGTRISWCGQQVVITGIVGASPSLQAYASVQQFLPGGQSFIFSYPVSGSFGVGDVVKGSITGALGVVTGVSGANMNVQVIPTSGGNIAYFSSIAGETLVGPNGSLPPTGISPIPPSAVSVWDDEVMNTFRGYPWQVFYDQGRLGFCTFPGLPSAIAWGAINLPNDMYVSSTASVTAASAILEFVPNKSQALFVVPGMESSEFVFCDNAIYYIPITAQLPLAPGSIAFNKITDQGCYSAVKPQPIQQSILYVKQGGVKMGAVQVPGYYNRPYIIDDVSEFHSHLFVASAPVAIAAPQSTGQYEESYAYVLLANGTVVVGKYSIRGGLIEPGQDNKPKIGWAPWSGRGFVRWITAQGSDVAMTTVYPTGTGNGFSNGFSLGFGGTGYVSVVEMQDNTRYLDGSILYNNVPTPLVTGGKGPLFFIAGGFVTVMDYGTRQMGVYQVSSTGYLVPQNIGGENLTSSQLVCGQAWTATLEPFAPDAGPGQDIHQRMFKRRVMRMATYVSSSTGFLLARLFSGPLTPTSPALGTVMNNYRVTTYNQGDDATQAPPLREEVQRWRPLGRSYDPRVAIIKDTPGPLVVHEVSMEITV